MKQKQIWITTGIVGVAAAAYFLVRKYRQSSESETINEDLSRLETATPVGQPSRHLTGVFSKAKQQMA